MKIAAIHRTSFVDYPGKMAAVVFAQGCNLNCSYCHNRTLVANDSALKGVADREVIGYLRKRQGLLDAVVITGGEPTIQPDLAVFMEQLRRLGYFVKLDTNGTRPVALKTLMHERLLDYVAMDIKAPMNKYEAVCGVAIDTTALEQSIETLLAGTTDYEFRTTLIPNLTREDILTIGRRIQGARRYVLQRYREPEQAIQLPHLQIRESSPDSTWIYSIVEDLKHVVHRCHSRGFDARHRIPPPD